MLDITAQPAAPGSNPYNLPYDSGLITTDKSFSQTYGYFEVDAELPSGQGFWPAFWLLPASNDYTSELDVFEAIDRQSTTIYSTVHGTTGGNWGSDSQAFKVPDTASGFHTYGVDWEPTTTTFYVDGIETGSAPTPSSMDDPMFMLLNFAVGGNGSWPGAPDAGTKFPASLKIDWVHAYATAGTSYVGGAAAITVATPPTTPPPVPPITIGSGASVLALAMSEDAWQGDAQFFVSVDGVQIGGLQSITAAHATGATRTLDVLGNFKPGPHTLAVNFLNDSWGGSAQNDRNLYVDSATINGVAVPGAALSLLKGGSQSFSFTAPGAVAGPIAIGNGPDAIVLSICEDAWQGNAQYTINVDGTPIGGTLTATASRAAHAAQRVTLNGNWGTGAHTVAVAFLNAAQPVGGGAGRDLYVNSLTYDARSATPATVALTANTTASFVTAASGAGTITLLMAEDAWQGHAQYTVAIDGRQVGKTRITGASHAAGQTQAVNIAGLLAPGAHDIAVSFLNDLYGGSAATDRNLYVRGIDVNGTLAPGSAGALLSSGTEHFSVVIPSH